MSSNIVILAEKLKKGEIAVIPTDTIYGLSTNALLSESVEEVYRVKGRSPGKPMIILISKISDLELFNIKLDEITKKILKKVWPGKVSVIFPCKDKKLSYLHRGKNSLAFRLPKKKNLLEIIEASGPLASTSANPEGSPVAKTITQAKKYFKRGIHTYVDEGRLESLPSTLIEITSGEVKILRQGEEII